MSTLTSGPGHEQQFDPALLPLAPATLVVEASAGTGKTTSIAKVAVRAIAEGFATIDQILLVTFTTKAAAELRSRVYGALNDGIAELSGQTSVSDVLRGAANDPAALGRLREAISHFDRASISTIHEFAARALTELGIHADHDSGHDLRPRLEAVSAEITEDLFLERARRGESVGPLEMEQRLVHASLEHLDAALVKGPPGRIELASRAREIFEHRKRTQGMVFFDDLIARLGAALTDPSPLGNQARALLGRRYRLVTIDEFQDTDLGQWKLLNSAFGDQTLLLLIGDPKQSIYRFRRADVHAYLSAANTHQRRRLSSNYRSTAAVTRGVGAILNGASLGAQITTPAVHGVGSLQLVSDAPSWKPAVEVRQVGDDDPTTSGGTRFKAVAEDLAEQVQALLESDSHWEASQPGLARTGPVRTGRVQRRDVAVLVRSSYRVQIITEALAARGIGSVGGGGDPLQGTAGRDWRQLLSTLRDVRAETVRKAALTSLVGWTLPQLVKAEADELDHLASTLRELSNLWQARGMAALAEAVYSTFGLYERLLAVQGGTELLSDLITVAEACHQQTHLHHVTPDGLIQWLAEPAREELTHRMGSDEDLVQVMTIHSAKGLGFPIVLLPDLWFPTKPPRVNDQPRLFHDARPEATNLVGLDVSLEASRYPDAEEQDEELRLTYVAMTRARAALKVWWAASGTTNTSPLHRLLTHQEPGSLPADAAKLRDAQQVRNLVQGWAEDPRFAPLAITRASPVAQTALTPRSDPPILQARSWTRTIDHDWRRPSYSGLTAALHEEGPAPSTVEAPGEVGLTLDEPDLDVSADPASPAGEAIASPMLGIAGGADFGTLVHAILEQVDPAADDLRTEIATIAELPLKGFGHEVGADQLIDALVSVLHTPLGSLTGGTLADIAVSDRLAELDFEMTMGSNDDHGTVADLAALFDDRSLLPAEDPLAHYGQALSSTTAAPQALRGFLNGSIDAVLRVPSGDPDRPGHKFVVVDYKTNSLPVAPGAALTVNHYHAAAMTAAMVNAHYPLQALIYSIALHRHLSWTLPGYHPEHHLGGVGYLFVRGMAGPTTPELGGMPAGVFTWRPPARFILAADSVLGGH